MILSPVPDGDFTQAPNALIRCEYLTAGQKETWLMIASICRHGKSSDDVRSWSEVAKANGIPYKKFMDAQKSLRKAQALIRNEDGDWELVVPTGEAPEPTIEDEVVEQPKRKHSLTQKEAWELIKEAWNKNKPEAFFRLDGSVKLPWYIAFETQAKRLNIEREDYGKFVGQVCRGASADEWWSKRDMKFSSVFGYGALKDRQFENVEKLYKAGANVEAKIDYGCDADILARYHDKGVDKTRVIRLEAGDQFAASEHLSSIPDEEYDESAAYIYFAPNKEKPVYWSLKSKAHTSYLFS